MGKRHKLVSLKVNNIMRIKAVEVRPDGSLVLVGGKNAQGKTSLLESIAMLIGGLKHKVKRPVGDHGDEGEIVGDFGDLIMRRVFKKSDGSTSLVVSAKDGARYTSPQTMLDTMYSALTFDPLAFSRMDSDDQVKTLAAVAGVDLAGFASKRLGLYEKRRDVGRDAKQKVAATRVMPHHDDAPKERTSTSDLLVKLEAARARNDARAANRRDLTALGETAEVVEADLAMVNAHIEKLTTQAQEIQSKHESICRAIGARKAKPITKDEDLTPFSKRITDADTDNRKYDDNLALGDALGEGAALTAEYESLSEDIEALDAERDKAVRDADFGVADIGLTEDGVTFEGVPLAQCGSANETKVSTGIALALNPDLGILLIRGGSLIDMDNRKIIETMAKEADVQVWMEVVEEGKACSIILEDGEIKK